MIRKTLKFVFLPILAMILLALLAFSYLIYTEHGSRLAVDFAINKAAINAQYKTLQGTLAKGLTVNHVRYQDEAISLSIKQLEYQADWSLFDRHVDVSTMHIKDFEIWLKQAEKVDKKKQSITGFEWPFALDIKQLAVDNLIIHKSENSTQIQNIGASLQASGHILEVKKLQLHADEWILSSTATINSQDGLKYQLNPNLEINTTAWQVTSTGSVYGDLKSLQLDQNLMIDHPKINGDWSVTGQIQSLSTEPMVNLTLESHETSVIMDNQAVVVSDLQAVLAGTSNDFNFSIESDLQNESLPPAQLVVSGQGNTQHLQIDIAKMSTEAGQIELDGELDWRDQLAINGRLKLAEFNPKLLMPDWPGEVNGTAGFSINHNANGLLIVIKNNDIRGILKNQPFKLQGNVEYNNQQILAEQVLIGLGVNTLQADGHINNDQVDMSITLDWSDLSLFDPALNGHINGNLSLSGQYENPEFIASISAQSIHHKKFEIEQLSLNSQGVWQQDIKAEINANHLQVNNRVFNHIVINQTGWLDAHQIDIEVKHDDMQQNISLSGDYDLNGHLWQGQLQQHQLTMNSGNTISLLEPVDILWAETIDMTPACWQGEAQGTLCLDFHHTTQQFAANLTVNAMSLAPFQMWLPENLELTGLVDGKAKISLVNHELNLESNLNINEGIILVGQPEGQKSEVAISKLKLLANSNQGHSQVELEFETSNGDELMGKAYVESNKQQQWMIDGSIHGTVNNTELLNAMTDEINEITGNITVAGTIFGALNHPEIVLNFSQPTGHIQLSRMGTLIEQLNLQINSQLNNNKPIYQVKVTGLNLAQVNQGKFLSEGVLTLSKGLNAQPNWSYQGHLSGDNFMIFNTPELKLNVSPNLDIVANQQNMSINGDLLFDQGRVVIEQLPPETVANSGDLVIQTKENESQQTEYPIIFDINAIIRDRIELDVIGLEAQLSGSMQLQQRKNQPLTAKGTLNLEEGKYEVYGQNLDINTGEMVFIGPIDNPKLNVRASRKSLDGEVIAGVQLGGTVNNLQSELFSNPALTDIEILSYIMTGNGIDQAGSINAEQLKQTAILIGLNQGAPVFRQIQNTFGIDVLTIKESPDAEDTVIEAGKKINNKLYVSYNHGIFNRLGFWVLKYKLNKFLNLQTTQGEDQSIELVYTKKADVKKDN
jgi:translocation and assembly module TamB